MAKTRLIDADNLMKRFRIVAQSGGPVVHHVSDICATIEDEAAEEPVDAAPVVHGRWEQVQRWATKAKYRCSVCGREIMSAAQVNIEKYPYCHCGAKMDGERKTNEN